MFSYQVKRYIRMLKRSYEKIENIQNAIGRIENRQMSLSGSGQFSDYEFKVFSQTGEDGLIQHLIRNIAVNNKIFVEFGVQDYTESNTRFLLQNDNWAGLVLDGSRKNVECIKSDPIYWKYNLKAECAFVDAENIDALIENNGITGEIGLLSIDIDGNDYWIWSAIDCINPLIVICEYNSIYGSKSTVTIPYEKTFDRSKAHYSNLYYGASISALSYLAEEKNYSLVGSNAAGNNVFFVRNDHLSGLQTFKPDEVYIKSQFRESRDVSGNLSFIGDGQRLELIKELAVYDIVAGKEVKIKDISF